MMRVTLSFVSLCCFFCFVWIHALFSRSQQTEKNRDSIIFLFWMWVSWSFPSRYHKQVIWAWIIYRQLNLVVFTILLLSGFFLRCGTRWCRQDCCLTWQKTWMTWERCSGIRRKKIGLGDHTVLESTQKFKSPFSKPLKLVKISIKKKKPSSQYLKVLENRDYGTLLQCSDIREVMKSMRFTLRLRRFRP